MYRGTKTVYVSSDTEVEMPHLVNPPVSSLVAEDHVQDPQLTESVSPYYRVRGMKRRLVAFK